METVRADVAQALKQVLAKDIKLFTCAGRFTEQTIKTYALHTPAVGVAILKTKTKQHYDTGEFGNEIMLIAYVITSDIKQDSRDTDAIAIVNQLQTWLALQDNMDMNSIEATNMLSVPLSKKNVALWSVSWRKWYRLDKKGEKQ